MKTIRLDPADDFLLDNRYYPAERPWLHQRNCEIRRRYWDQLEPARALAKANQITEARVLQICRGRTNRDY